jgi:hypothetical protein
VSLGVEQRGDGGRIDAAGHGNRYGFGLLHGAQLSMITVWRGADSRSARCAEWWKSGQA